MLLMPLEKLPLVLLPRSICNIYFRILPFIWSQNIWLNLFCILSQRSFSFHPSNKRAFLITTKILTVTCTKISTDNIHVVPSRFVWLCILCNISRMHKAKRGLILQILWLHYPLKKKNSYLWYKYLSPWMTNQTHIAFKMHMQHLFILDTSV